MAVGRMSGERQESLFVAAGALGALGSPFYGALDGLLRERGFDEFAERVVPSSTRTGWAGPLLLRGCVSGC